MYKVYRRNDAAARNAAAIHELCVKQFLAEGRYVPGYSPRPVVSKELGPLEWSGEASRDFSDYEKSVHKVKTIRKVITRKTRKVIGYFGSRKMGSLALPWESNNELMAFQLLEIDNSVRHFWPHVERLDFTVDGIKTNYWPDILVFRMDGSQQLIQVKGVLPKEKKEGADGDSDIDVTASPDDMSRLHELYREIYASFGIEHVVWDKTYLTQQPRLDNACELFKRGARHVSQENAFEASVLFNKYQPKTVGDFLERLPQRSRSLEFLYGLATHGYFDLDIESTLLSLDTKITSDFQIDLLNEIR